MCKATCNSTKGKESHFSILTLFRSKEICNSKMYVYLYQNDYSTSVMILSTTIGLIYPLRKYDSKWAFQMGIWNDCIAIFGKDCHIWKTTLRSLHSNVT